MLRLALVLLTGFFLAGCGSGHRDMLERVGALHAQNEQLKEQAETYAQLMAQNQLALGRLIEEHHMLEDQAITETCKPRMF